jgi:hypothetical protein
MMMINLVSQRRHQASQGPQNVCVSASSSKISTPTKRRQMLSEHAKKPKARVGTLDVETYSEHSYNELSDQDDDKRKPAGTVAGTSPQ